MEEKEMNEKVRCDLCHGSGFHHDFICGKCLGHCTVSWIEKMISKNEYDVSMEDFVFFEKLEKFINCLDENISDDGINFKLSWFLESLRVGFGLYYIDFYVIHFYDQRLWRRKIKIFVNPFSLQNEFGGYCQDFILKN